MSSLPNGCTNHKRDFALIITTTVAAIFNLLIILVISFSIGPQISKSLTETHDNYNAILKNRDILEHAHKDIMDFNNEVLKYRDALKRFNAILGAAEKKSKEKLDRDKLIDSKEKNK